MIQKLSYESCEFIQTTAVEDVFILGTDNVGDESSGGTIRACGVDGGLRDGKGVVGTTGGAPLFIDGICACAVESTKVGYGNAVCTVALN